MKTMLVLCLLLTTSCAMKFKHNDFKPDYEMKKDYSACRAQAYQGCGAFCGALFIRSMISDCMEGNGWERE